MPRSIALTAFLATGIAACSLVLQTSDEQCAVDADCARRGTAFAGMRCVDRVCVGASDGGGDVAADAPPADPVWGCLGSVVFPPPAKAKVKVTIPFVELVQKTPVTDIKVRVCARLDVGCANPVAPLKTPGADGRVTFDVDANFDGFAEVVPGTDRKSVV